VESSDLALPVVSWSRHVRSDDSGLCLVFVIRVGEVSPDPSWSNVHGTIVITEDKLLTEVVVVIDCNSWSFGESPLQCFLVDVFAHVFVLVKFMETS